MRPLVSVVVPAHNPGRYIEPCIRSILLQTLRPDQFEAIFVDDGSTDGTAERLNRLAGEHRHLRVIHIPASGAPGRPRNVGLEAARGEYVHFLDADDELAPGALERLYRTASHNESDVVLGKFASETMVRRQDLFKRNRPATTLQDTPALADASMALGAKLYRTALLRENGIAFPEGWRQMEDQLFTLRAYLAARWISVLADEPSYYFNKREDEGHISAEQIDPRSHVEHLGQILEVVEAGVADPALRRRLMARFYRTEVLARLAGPRFMDAPVVYQAQLFEALRGLARDRIRDGVHSGLGAVGRIRSRLLLDGDLTGLLAFVRRIDTFVLDARVRSATWSNGRLLIEYGAGLLRGPDGRPLTFVLRNDATYLEPAVADDLVGPIDVSDELGMIRPQLSLVDQATSLDWIVPGSSSLTLRTLDGAPSDVRQPRLRGLVVLDPQGVGPGHRPLDDGRWEFVARILGLGLRATGPLRVGAGPREPGRPLIRPALLGSPPRWVVPGADGDDALWIAIGRQDRLPAAIDPARRRLLSDGDALVMALPVITDGNGTIATGRLEATGEGGTYSIPAIFRGEMTEVVVVARVRGSGAIPPGRYDLTAHLGAGDSPGLPIGAAQVRENGRFAVAGIAREPRLARLASWTRWYADILREKAVELRGAIRARVVQPVRQAIRGRRDAAVADRHGPR